MNESCTYTSAVARIVVGALKPTEQVLEDAFKALGCERWGGASSNGWSKIGDFLRCPYRYYLKHERGMLAAGLLVDDSTSAQDTGSFAHVMLAAHYAGMLPDDRYPGFRVNCPTPEQVDAALSAAGAEVEALQKAREVWEGYLDFYGEDGWAPMAVEMPAGLPEFHTCRYDVIVSVEDGIHDGIWEADHKILSPKSEVENYELDGEILGQMLAWKLSGLASVFGPLEGVCVNVLYKGKMPKGRAPYLRRWFRYDEAAVKDFGRQRLYWQDSVERLRMQKGPIVFWPKSHYGCIGHYFDRCGFWDHCASLNDSLLVSKDHP